VTGAGLPAELTAVAVATVVAALVLGAAVAVLVAWSARRRRP
jgi:hypothetical protein